MDRLFLNTGIQYMQFPLGDVVAGELDRLSPEHLAANFSWSSEPVENARWAKWRLLRSEREEDGAAYYELLVAVDTSEGPASKGFIARSEMERPSEPFFFEAGVSNGSLQVRCVERA